MFDTQWWAHALICGSVAALGIGVVLTAVIFAVPWTFLSNYPADIREAAPTPTRAQRRAGLIAGIIFMIVLVTGIGAVVVSWGLQHPSAGLLELAAMTLVAVLLFALVDIVIIDWLIICTWQPAAIVFPGTEHCAGWRDYGFHVRAQFELLISSAVIGVIAWLLM